MFNVIKSHTLKNLSNFKSMEKSIDDKVSMIVKEHKANTDIYHQEKTKLKTNDSGKYFTCENCGRSISGGRFAQHINKCLERGRR